MAATVHQSAKVFQLRRPPDTASAPDPAKEMLLLVMNKLDALEARQEETLKAIELKVNEAQQAATEAPTPTGTPVQWYGWLLSSESLEHMNWNRVILPEIGKANALPVASVVLEDWVSTAPRRGEAVAPSDLVLTPDTAPQLATQPLQNGVQIHQLLEIGASLIGLISTVSLALWIYEDIPLMHPVLALLSLIASPFVYLMGRAARLSLPPTSTK